MDATCYHVCEIGYADFACPSVVAGSTAPALTASSWAANASPRNKATELEKAQINIPMVPASGPYVPNPLLADM